MLEIKLIDKDGRPFPRYLHEGKEYIEAIKNFEFTLELKNTTNKRIEVVCSIDGKDICNRKTADLSHRGYILKPYEVSTIKGYKVDDKTVLAFKFTDKEKSFAVDIEKENGENVGVLGFAVFEEQELIWNYPEKIESWEEFERKYSIKYPMQPKPIWIYPYWEENHKIFPEYYYYYNPFDTEVICTYSSNTNYEPIMEVKTATQNVGTGIGETKEQKTNLSWFFRKSETPSFMKIIYYDDYDGLKARGIKIENKIYDLPNPFPGVKKYEKENEKEEKFEIIL